jgi:hypothetical protein
MHNVIETENDYWVFSNWSLIGWKAGNPAYELLLFLSVPVENESIQYATTSFLQNLLSSYTSRGFCTFINTLCVKFG